MDGAWKVEIEGCSHELAKARSYTNSSVQVHLRRYGGKRKGAKEKESSVLGPDTTTTTIIFFVLCVEGFEASHVRR